MVQQKFSFERNKVWREVASGKHSDRSSIRIENDLIDLAKVSPDKAWAVATLKGAVGYFESTADQPLRIVDLYSGVGGFSAGFRSAAHAVGLNLELLGCLDLDPTALRVFQKNFSPRICLKKNVESILDYQIRFDDVDAKFAYEPEILDPVIKDLVGSVDIVIGGPPCQGNSNYNNHTRRVDPKNYLYLTVPAMGVALGADVIAIENVPAVKRASLSVVDKARSVLENSGYHVDDTILDADRHGVPQQRKRHFLVACKNKILDLQNIAKRLEVSGLSAWDAIQDLEEIESSQPFDQPAEISETNLKRIKHLFDKDLYDLPDAVRPDCHKDGHTYPSVYGRMYKDKPALTITSGFMSPGRGRYTHPTIQRSLTPHEGARLQGFSDTFEFESDDGVPLNRSDYAKLIGDAVPPPLAYVIGMACISALQR